MRKVLVDALTFGRMYMRSKVGAFFTFIFPILLVLLFGAVFAETAESTINLPTQDLDGSGMSRAFLAALNNTTVVRVSAIPSNVEIEAYIREHSLDVALQIPKGFEREIFASLQGGAVA